MIVKLIVLAFFVVMALTGCAIVSEFLDSITSGGESTALERATNTVAPFLGPYGDLLILAGFILQNGWLGFRKVQKVRNGTATTPSGVPKSP